MIKKLVSIAAVAFFVVSGCEYVSSPSDVGSREHSENLVTLTDANFQQQVLNSEAPVLVDFTATWCGPCKRMAPAINDLADEFAGRAVVGKLDVDENKATTSEYGVQGFPTMLIFDDGEVVDRFVGVTSKDDLAAKLSSLVSE